MVIKHKHIRTGTYDRCVYCDKAMVTSHVYERMDLEERKKWVKHCGRGLCNTCHKRMSRRGRLKYFTLTNIFAGTIHSRGSKKGRGAAYDSASTPATVATATATETDSTASGDAPAEPQWDQEAV